MSPRLAPLCTPSGGARLFQWSPGDVGTSERDGRDKIGPGLREKRDAAISMLNKHLFQSASPLHPHPESAGSLTPPTSRPEPRRSLLMIYRMQRPTVLYRQTRWWHAFCTAALPALGLRFPLFIILCLRRPNGKLAVASFSSHIYGDLRCGDSVVVMSTICFLNCAINIYDGFHHFSIKWGITFFLKIDTICRLCALAIDYVCV